MNGDAALVAVLRRTKASSGKAAPPSLEDGGSRQPLGLHAGLGHYLSHSDRPNRYQTCNCASIHCDGGRSCQRQERVGHHTSGALCAAQQCSSATCALPTALAVSWPQGSLAAPCSSHSPVAVPRRVPRLLKRLHLRQQQSAPRRPSFPTHGPPGSRPTTSPFGPLQPLTLISRTSGL
jgi:hypothetical protein